MTGYNEELFGKWTERLVVYLLLNMKKDMTPNSSDDYQKYIDIIVNGIESRYPEVFEYVGYGEHSVTNTISDEVDSILTMYQTMQRALNYYSEEERMSLLQEYDVRFPGFSADDAEQGYLIYYNFLQKHDRASLPEVINQTYASLSLQEYRDMYQTYCEIMSSSIYHHCDDECPPIYLVDIKRVLSVVHTRYMGTGQYDFISEDNSGQEYNEDN